MYSTSNIRFNNGFFYTETYLADDALFVSNVPNYPIPDNKLSLLNNGPAKFEIASYIDASP